VVAPTRRKASRWSFTRAVRSPVTTGMEIAPSSRAWYRISPMGAESRWISSTKRIEPFSRSARIPISDPGRRELGPGPTGTASRSRGQ
jgi:hypothetical protein